MAFYNVHKSSMSMKLASNNIFWYTCIHTKTTYDVFAHSGLPTSIILALGLLEKKDEEQFCVGGDNAFWDIWRFPSVFWQV